MIFASFASGEAEGVILAHTLRLPGRLLKKGHRLTSCDILELQQHGVAAVSGARLEPGDVGEDAAALAVATALAGRGLQVGKPAAGRCNLYALQHGLAVIDRARVDAVNLADGAITVATLLPDDEAEAGQTVATVKVVPFAVAPAVVAACCRLAAGGESAGMGTAVIDVWPFRQQRIGLLLSDAESVKPALLDATREVMRQRLQALGNAIHFERRCSHTQGELMLAIQAAQQAGCELLLISGATVTVDVADVVPAALQALGGEIIQFGMPVEPGNMLLLARIGALAVINLPGCGRSPKLNGFDWVLQRTLAGMAVSRRDILLMGVGGLIKDVPHRPRKQRPLLPVGARAMPGGSLLQANSETMPRVAAIILAAGSSRRMGEQNKLLAPVVGRPMLVQVAAAALAASVAQVLVVTGFQAEAVQATLAGSPVGLVYNPEYATGMASSLRTGLAALGDDIDAAIILLGDMRFVDAAQVNALIRAFDPDRGHDIVAPVCNGRRGNPVLWARRYFDEMQLLQGDVGARSLLQKYADRVVEVAVTGDAVLTDIDTPEMLQALAGEG